MQIEITGHHIDITDSMREYVNEKVARVTKHYSGVLNAHVVLSVEKLVSHAEATLHVAGDTLHANADNSDMYAAIDALADKLIRQVDKYKGKLKDYRGNNAPSAEE